MSAINFNHNGGPASARHENSDSTWRHGIQSVNDESAGLLDISIIDGASGTALLVAALHGKYEAAVLLKAVTQAAGRVKQAARRKPALCICCPRTIKRITATTVFGIATPSIASPTGAIGFVFCDRCAEDPTTLPAKAANGLRGIWPDLRPVVITHATGGRA